jgi:hypothetical protein
VAEVDGAEAARPQGAPHLITAEGRGWGRRAPRRRGRSGIRACREPRKQDLTCPSMSWNCRHRCRTSGSSSGQSRHTSSGVLPNSSISLSIRCT